MAFKIQALEQRRRRPMHVRGTAIVQSLHAINDTLARLDAVSKDLSRMDAAARKALSTQGAKVKHMLPKPAAALAGPAAALAQPASQPDSTNAFAGLVRQVNARTVNPIDAIRGGLPAALLRDAGAYFALPVQRINGIARVPNTTAHNWTRQNMNMDAAASERVWRMADVAAMAREIFGTEEGAKAWLCTVNRAFDNSTPLDYLDTEPGAAAVRQVLNAIATGGVA